MNRPELVTYADLKVDDVILINKVERRISNLHVLSSAWIDGISRVSIHYTPGDDGATYSPQVERVTATVWRQS